MQKKNIAFKGLFQFPVSVSYITFPLAPVLAGAYSFFFVLYLNILILRRRYRLFYLVHRIGFFYILVGLFLDWNVILEWKMIE